ncbi:unnamed protein product [Medioppia subpectinata]|uniref:Glucose-methanol-choline oxidoreductase N-terminal domain-containing protein n=1 Tax=Medioppia subpectinata TaxID=1979941 RepID=A0A7R9QBA4_9ACAR|nr:unnamed protein product [Medioppia subpectinata]CAG2117825.1 unnamed protein product [Medioppia subpectinata]
MGGEGNRLRVNEWLYYNEPRTGFGQQYAGGRAPDHKGKTLGGSTAHNAMVFNRGNSRGYDEWANTYGAVGWSYRDVLPVFREWENNTDPEVNPEYHGTRGPIQISSPQVISPLIYYFKDALNELGFKDTDINGPKQLGTMFTQSFITAQGFRADTGNAFVDPNPYPDNLHIVCKAFVTKILFNGLTAIGVEFIVNDISYTVYANKEVIVSGGAINSPQLLMLSGLGPKRHLQSLGIRVVLDLPVGDNYQNQPTITVAVTIKPEYINLTDRVAALTTEQLSLLYFNQSGPLASSVSCALHYNTPNNVDKEWPNGILYASTANDTFIMYTNLGRFKSTGTLRLQSTSPYVPPVIDANWFAHPDDRQDVLDATMLIFYILERSSFAQYLQITSDLFGAIGCPVCPDKQYLYECVDGLKCFVSYYTESGYHPGGGCRMGSTHRPDVVVDPQLRVKGIKNLRVCDSSVFPVLPNSNTASASIMVGYKCAKYIVNHYNL